MDLLNNKSNSTNEGKKSQPVTTKDNLDIPSTSKITSNENKSNNKNKNDDIDSEIAENLSNDVDFIENSQEIPVVQQTPKTLKRTKSKTDDHSKLKGKSKKTPVKDIGSLFYSSDEDECNSKLEQGVGLLSELDNLVRPETVLQLEKTNEVMDVSSSDELMEVCVETPKKLPLRSEQKNEHAPSETNSKRKSLITDYYTIK